MVSPGYFIRDLILVPEVPTTLYAVVRQFPGQKGSVFKTTDGGNSWFPSDLNLTDRSVRHVAVNRSGTCLHASTENGLL